MHPVGSKNSCGLALVVCGTHQKVGSRTRWLRITDSRVRHCFIPDAVVGEAFRYTARGAVALERFAEDTNGALVYTFTTPWSNGTTWITLLPGELLEKLAALVPLPQVHLVRYECCVAPHSSLRGAITPTPRQQGVEGDDATTESPCWSWARLLKQVFALDMVTCPFCRQGSLRMTAAITQAEMLRKMLRHLQLAADPPPIAPARARQATFDWVA